MKDEELKSELTVEGWALWKRYVKLNNIKCDNGNWPDYDIHEFMKINDLVEGAKDEQVVREGGSNPEGDKPLVPGRMDEASAVVEQMELFPYDHIPDRREAHGDELSLQKPCHGPSDLGPPGEPKKGV